MIKRFYNTGVRTIRAALFSLVKFYLQKDVSSKDVLPIVNFLLTVKHEGNAHPPFPSIFSSLPPP
jgi:hypothetical protein